MSDPAPSPSPHGYVDLLTDKDVAQHLEQIALAYHKEMVQALQDLAYTYLMLEGESNRVSTFPDKNFGPATALVWRELRELTEKKLHHLIAKKMWERALRKVASKTKNNDE